MTSALISGSANRLFDPSVLNIPEIASGQHRMDGFFQTLRANKKKMTLHDAVLSLKPMYHWEVQQLRAGGRALLSMGGKHHDLLVDGFVTPSLGADKRPGRPERWSIISFTETLAEDGVTVIQEPVYATGRSDKLTVSVNFVFNNPQIDAVLALHRALDRDMSEHEAWIEALSKKGKKTFFIDALREITNLREKLNERYSSRRKDELNRLLTEDNLRLKAENLLLQNTKQQLLADPDFLDQIIAAQSARSNGAVPPSQASQ